MYPGEWNGFDSFFTFLLVMCWLIACGLTFVVARSDPSKRRWPGCLALVWVGRYAFYLTFYMLYALSTGYDHRAFQEMNPFVPWLTSVLYMCSHFGWDQLMLLLSFQMAVVKKIDLKEPKIKYPFMVISFLFPIFSVEFEGIQNKWISRHNYLFNAMDLDERNTMQLLSAAWAIVVLFLNCGLAIYIMFSFVTFWRQSTANTMIKTETAGSVMREKATLKVVAEGVLLALQLGTASFIVVIMYGVNLSPRDSSPGTDFLRYHLRAQDSFAIRKEMLILTSMLYCYWDNVLAFWAKDVTPQLQKGKGALRQKGVELKRFLRKKGFAGSRTVPMAASADQIS